MGEVSASSGSENRARTTRMDVRMLKSDQPKKTTTKVLCHFNKDVSFACYLSGLLQRVRRAEHVKSRPAQREREFSNESQVLQFRMEKRQRHFETPFGVKKKPSTSHTTHRPQGSSGVQRKVCSILSLGVFLLGTQ